MREAPLQPPITDMPCRRDTTRLASTAAPLSLRPSAPSKASNTPRLGDHWREETWRLREKRKG